MRMFKKLALPLIVFTMLVTIVACGTFNQNSYRAMGIMEASYDAGMKAAGDLRAKGLISDEGRQAIIDAGREYMKAHNDSVDAFTAYLQAEDPHEKDQLKHQYIAASRVTLSFYSAVMAILSKSGYVGETVEPWF